MKHIGITTLAPPPDRGTRPLSIVPYPLPYNLQARAAPVTKNTEKTYKLQPQKGGVRMVSPYLPVSTGG